ncbi:hypothetical protein [Flavobacterium hungaricum]|uniref:Uncharacterized protein n=1 Tax=Flavobacterium hungaricum TaxID=2082725 RepID=A0ABR9TP17_9FLAO|nr:hypothetical protein [Flavobacterium hungaricum]MBE8727088.1 hypothetical protein [Flavobacterium hungaricum]
MKLKIIIPLFLLFSFNGNSQTNTKLNIDDLVSNYIKELQSRKIDTISVYESYCVGCVMTFDSPLNDDAEKCIDDLTNSPVFIFWKEKEKTFLSKANYCYEYSKILIRNDNFWQIYF